MGFAAEDAKIAEIDVLMTERLRQLDLTVLDGKDP